ncbi:MAG: hypothetical protein HY080_07695 [Gammaproteobacteria bacterium]|nr:hypothetical protein [Gammaproteobacteria bacterium]
MSHFGKDSLFVRALSDFHTLKIAKMMYDTGQLHNFETVKLYVDEPSVEAIWFLARQCELVGKPLFQAPLGSTRSGAIEAAVDLS